MAMSDQRVIATAGIISVSVGSANSIFRNKRLPSSRFLIGSGVAYLILSALAEGEPELAKGLAIGVMTTILLGEGGGVLSYINHGEIDTQKPEGPKLKVPTSGTLQRKGEQNIKAGRPPLAGIPGYGVDGLGGDTGFRSDTLTPIPGH